MRQVFVILAVLMFHAPLVVSAQDNSTICTNDGNCYTQCVLAPIQCEPLIDAKCITYWGRQDWNEVSYSCSPDL